MQHAKLASDLATCPILNPNPLNKASPCGAGLAGICAQPASVLALQQHMEITPHDVIGPAL